MSIEQNASHPLINSKSSDNLTTMLDSTQPDTTSKDMSMTTETAIAAGDSSQLNVSSAKVWNTTELLVEILSYLTASELITASEVSLTFYYGILGSSKVRKMLFLTPNGKTPQKWRMLHQEIGLFTRDAGFHLEPKPCFQMVELCPLLEVRSYGHMQSTRRVLVHNDCEVTGFTNQPTPRLANMLLTDPPPNEAYVYLKYTHSASSTITLSVSRTVKVHGPLTLGALMAGALEAKGDMQFEERQFTPTVTRVQIATKRRVSLEAEMRQQLEIHGGHFVLNIHESRVNFKYAVAPSPEEWKEMEEKASAKG